MKAVAITAIVVAGLIAQPARAVDGAKLFADSCAVCHTIGGGDLVGPDLIRVAQSPRADVQKAVKRMEDNVGPLAKDQIEALVGFLKAPDAKARLAAATAPPVEMSPEEKAALASTGRALFFGEQPLANRGTPCFACHSVAGRGGSLAVDLTAVYSRRGNAALLKTAEEPAIPLMKAAYRGRPITRQEAFHLAAFFKSVPAGAAPVKERTAPLYGIAGGAAAAALAGVAIVFRSRRAGVRSRMVRKSRVEVKS